MTWWEESNRRFGAEGVTSKGLMCKFVVNPLGALTVQPYPEEWDVIQLFNKIVSETYPKPQPLPE